MGSPDTLRERKKAQQRQAIIDVAHRLFVERGYGETTVDAICREAAISPPTFFRYFPTKPDVFFAGSEDIVAEWSAIVLASKPNESLLTVMKRATRAIGLVPEPRVRLARLRGELVRTDVEVRRKSLELDHDFVERIADVIAEYLGLDPTTDVRPHLVARCTMAAVRSAQSVVARSGRPETLVATIDRSFDALAKLDATLARKRRATH